MHITILGGGLSGAACALHYLRDHPHQPARITVVEPRATLGAGLAYATPATEHRTNVAAARMSVLPEQPTHFHDWLHEVDAPSRDPASAMPDGRLYPSRALFGQYVNATLLAQAAATPEVGLCHVKASARALYALERGFTIELDDGQSLAADAVVLAMTHPPPDPPAELGNAAGRLVSPWDLAALNGIASDARVLIVGTGLTACDVIATLSARGHAGPITAVSRHGLLPRPRTTLPVSPDGDFRTHPTDTPAGLLRRVRRAVAEAAASGRPWEGVVDALREQALVVWGALDWRQRRTLLRHARTYWDVHRYQCAPQIDALLTAAQASGALRVLAGHLLGQEETPDGLDVRLRPRHAADGAEERLTADVVINCTGPGHGSVVRTNPVLHGLAEAGALSADPAVLGIWVDGRSRVLRPDGAAWPNLFVAGPLARGTFGELMGLPQVNLQPRAVAAELAALGRASA
jgi:uncharacterized NAD(P)/FAD-binding protein YdhS